LNSKDVKSQFCVVTGRRVVPRCRLHRSCWTVLPLKCTLNCESYSHPQKGFLLACVSVRLIRPLVLAKPNVPIDSHHDLLRRPHMHRRKLLHRLIHLAESASASPPSVLVQTILCAPQTKPGRYSASAPAGTSTPHSKSKSPSTVRTIPMSLQLCGPLARTAVVSHESEPNVTDSPACACI